MATKARKAKARKPRAARPRQGHLDGMSPPSHPDIDRAADNYRAARDERMRLTEEEKSTKAILGVAMKKHELLLYTYDEYDVIVDPVEAIKVKKHKVESNGDDSEN